MKKTLLFIASIATAVSGYGQAITDDGTNVGIGNAAPSFKLDVDGDVNLSSGNKIRINGRSVVSTVGTGNTFIGDLAGDVNTTGYNNAFIGYKAGEVNNTGHSNAFIGFKAGERNTTGFANAFIGQQAGRANVGGKTNVMIGRRAGFASATGDDNVFIGHLTGQTNNGGSSNTYLGSGADGSAALTNASAIGANAIVTSSNSLVLGNGANVGIGNSAPAYNLDVTGDMNFTGDLYQNGVLFAGGGGATGPTGPSGINGLNGSNGIDGADGAPGAPGAAGADGTNGTDGADGAAGPAGPQGPTGPLVAGTTGQTLRHDGSGWVSSSLITNTGTDVNVGTTLDINSGAGNPVIEGGTSSTATGSYGIALGYSCDASGTNGSAAIGYNATATQNMSHAFGSYVSATGLYSMVLGRQASASANNAHVLGNGISSGTPLDNSISNSLMIGYESDVPTVFVGPSAGVGTTGNVGIGTAAPDAKLVIGTPLGSGWAVNAMTVGGSIGAAVEVGDVTNKISIDATSIFNRARITCSGASGYATGDIEFRVGNVGIGVAAPLNKLSVDGTADFTGNVGFGEATPSYPVDVASGTGNARAINVLNEYSGAATKYGVYNSVDAAGTGIRYGIYNFVDANAADNSTTYGIRSIADGNGNAGTVYGLFSSVNTSGTGNRYAIYGSASTSEPNPGVTKSWAGYFSGNTYFSQDVRMGYTADVPGFKLAVNGKVICEELLVQDSGDWPDYVFTDEYDLKTLEEVEAHIDANNHLPGVPDACTVEEEGIMVGQMQKVMMEKIEELTLYMIDANKQIIDLKSQVDELQNSK
jgi:hypothetical protein